MSTYKYNANDELQDLLACFTSRNGDGSDDVESDYLDTINLLIELNRGRSLMDIGFGEGGRFLNLAMGRMTETVGLEPDISRFTRYRDGIGQDELKSKNCLLFNKMADAYIAENPGKHFDMVILSMVIQHLATDTCRSILADADTLLKPDGIIVVSATLAPEAARGFSYQSPGPDDVYVPEAQFNQYAHDHRNQDKGVPVRRFSRKEFLACLAVHFDILLWKQFAYYLPDKVSRFANLLQIAPMELENVAHSQFAVLRKKADA